MVGFYGILRTPKDLLSFLALSTGHTHTHKAGVRQKGEARSAVEQTVLELDKRMNYQSAVVTPGASDPTCGHTVEVGKRKVREYDSTVEHLSALFQSESQSYAPCVDYLALFQDSSASSSERVSESWRRKLCEWCYEVVDHFQFDREAVFYALDYLDRTVAARAKASEEPPNKRQFQLLAVTALYIAIKLHGTTDNCDGPKRKLKVDSFVQLSRGFFTVENIEATEREMLTTLQWSVHPPTTIRFITFFLRLFPNWCHETNVRAYQNTVTSLFDVSRYLAELAVCSSKCSLDSNSSMIGYVCVLSALDILAHKVPMPHQVRVDFLNILADVTGLVPEAKQVKYYYATIKDLCPGLFENQDLPPEFNFDTTASDLDSQAARVSPVSVMVDGNDTRRKRSRTETVSGAR